MSATGSHNSDTAWNPPTSVLMQKMDEMGANIQKLSTQVALLGERIGHMSESRASLDNADNELKIRVTALENTVAVMKADMVHYAIVKKLVYALVLASLSLAGTLVWERVNQQKERSHERQQNAQQGQQG